MSLYSQFGRWYAFIRVYDEKTDKRKRIKRSTGVIDDGTRGSRERAALSAARIERRFAAQGVGANRTTLKQAFVRLINARELAGQGTERTLYAAKAVFEGLGPDQVMADISDQTLSTYARIRLKTVTADTVRREFAELTRAYKEVSLKPPKLPKLAKPRRGERWLTPDECYRLLAYVPAHRQRHVVSYLHLGLRRSELYKVDVPFSNEVRVRGTKTEGADRIMPLSPAALAALSAPLEPWSNGNRDLKRYAHLAGLGRVTFTDLRRTFATQLAMAGVPILHLMHLMGHKSTRMLEQVYARVGAGQHMHDAIARLPWAPRTEAGHAGPLESAKSVESCTDGEPKTAENDEEAE